MRRPCCDKTRTGRQRWPQPHVILGGGTLLCFSDNRYGQCDLPPGLGALSYCGRRSAHKWKVPAAAVALALLGGSSTRKTQMAAAGEKSSSTRPGEAVLRLHNTRWQCPRSCSVLPTLPSNHVRASTRRAGRPTRGGAPWLARCLVIAQMSRKKLEQHVTSPHPPGSHSLKEVEPGTKTCWGRTIWGPTIWAPSI